MRSSLADRLVEGIAAQDRDLIAACFAPAATLRALIPSGLRERMGASDAATLIHGWFKDSTELELLETHEDRVGDRTLISYRFEGVEDGQAYVVEQHIACVVVDDRIDHADLLCSGFRPRALRAG